jgi:hypothetical protein
VGEFESFERTVFAEEIVGPANHEPIDLFAKRLHRLVALLLLLVGRVAIAALDDGQLELLVELGRRAERARVAEIDEGEVFDKVVLFAPSRQCGKTDTSEEANEPGWACL